VSKEINKTTEKYYSSGGRLFIESYCYLNLNTKQYFWMSEIIKDTKNVDHLARITEMDKSFLITNNAQEAR